MSPLPSSSTNHLTMHTLKTNNIVKIAAVLAVLGLLAMSALIGYSRAQADAFAFGKTATITAGSGTAQQAGDAAATTTVTFLQTSSTATSSITNLVGDASAFHLDLQATASSSATVYQYWIYYSMNGIDWYPENFTVTSPTSGSQVALEASTTVPHNWSPGTTAVTRKHVVVPVEGKYVKVDFGVTGANGSLWGGLTTKQETAN